MNPFAEMYPFTEMHPFAEMHFTSSKKMHLVASHRWWVDFKLEFLKDKAVP